MLLACAQAVMLGLKPCLVTSQVFQVQNQIWAWFASFGVPQSKVLEWLGLDETQLFRVSLPLAHAADALSGQLLAPSVNSHLLLSSPEQFLGEGSDNRLFSETMLASLGFRASAVS
jgi:hypothetical protein